VHQIAEGFTARVERLTSQPVTEAQWARFLTAYCGTEDAKASKRALSTRREQADQLNRLWTDDQRVTPWRGIAYGVLAAANTYAHHLAPVRGATRASGTPSNWSRASCTTRTATPWSLPPFESNRGPRP
jgi:hypothetical protein